ncbi:MAG: hypothetical protein KDI36_11770 [Pseudomonadales bacterium]|nr:hypothetical protein [Pseudomonadales bacterium]
MKRGYVPPEQPFRHRDHARPRTRREFIAQGFLGGLGAVMGGPALSLLSRPASALDIAPPPLCAVGPAGNNKIPFICVDLAGGANIAGSNVLIGKRGGQLDFLSTAGYSKQGLPGDMVPAVSAAADGLTDFVDTTLGLAFHADSAMLRGILERAPSAAAATNGAVIPARSQNDTGNNPHNPMYGISRAGQNGLGARGELLALIGSQSSLSGGNSMAPASMIDPEIRPTKVDRPSDATGLIDLGGLLGGTLSETDNVQLMEAVYRISQLKMQTVSTGTPDDTVLKNKLLCAYAQSADLAERFGSGPGVLDPTDASDNGRIVGPGGIFSAEEFNASDANGREFRKTASIMKLVIDGYAGAGTITMGGYDYHTGDRVTGEDRDLRAGRCIGACLEYAALMNKPLMIYVVSDGSVFSNGMIDPAVGKGVWTGDNQQTAAAFFLVYNPAGRTALYQSPNTDIFMHQQLGWMRDSGDVETGSSPAANNVNALVDMVILNYMALHGEQGLYASLFPVNSLGTDLDRWIAFEEVVNGTL